MADIIIHDIRIDPVLFNIYFVNKFDDRIIEKINIGNGGE